MSLCVALDLNFVIFGSLVKCFFLDHLDQLFKNRTRVIQYSDELASENYWVWRQKLTSIVI